MFRQVFNKLFGSVDTTTSSNRLNLSDSPVRNKAPIYAIPTVTSYFQSTSNESNFDLNVNINKQSSHEKIQKTNTQNKNISTPKFSDSHIRQIYIAPHCIRYSNSTLDDTIYRIDDESLNEIAAEILESDNSPPKLQIVFYDGKYYAINNSHLQIYKQLQLSGLITHVQADIISLEAIPSALRQHLLQPPCLNNSITNSNDTISDEDFDDTDEVSNQISNSSSSAISSNGIVEILSADILTPASIEMISKQMLVDETYEFGACENCAESDDEEENIKPDDDQEKQSVNTIMEDKEIMKNIKEEYEWKKYENLCSESFKKKSTEEENKTKKTIMRKNNSMILNHTDDQMELENLIS